MQYVIMCSSLWWFFYFIHVCAKINMNRNDQNGEITNNIWSIYVFLYQKSYCTSHFYMGLSGLLTICTWDPQLYSKDSYICCENKVLYIYIYIPRNEQIPSRLLEMWCLRVCCLPPLLVTIFTPYGTVYGVLKYQARLQLVCGELAKMCFLQERNWVPKVMLVIWIAYFVPILMK